MAGGDIGLEVLIPLACLLAILVAAVIYLICRYYVCDPTKRRRKKYSRNNVFGSPTVTGHPILPSFNKVIQTVQMKNGDQKTSYRDFGSPFPYKKFSYSKVSDEDIYYDKYDNDGRSMRSEASELSFFSDELNSPTDKSVQSEKLYRNKKLKRQKKRFHSDPLLLPTDSGTENVVDNVPPLEQQIRRISSLSSNRRISSASAALSLVSPAGGQIEFVLFYNSEQKTLDITINQLLDISLEPEIFLGILDVYDKGDKIPKTNKAYLKRNQNHTLELINADEIGFFIYVTLLPKKIFRKHTNVVFGPGSIVFNEKISLTGYSLEQLAPFFLCFHTLCKFGRDGEPIVLGEVKVPLKRLQNLQILPFMANLGPPKEELELESALRTSTDLGYLELYLSFDPMAQKLVVKLIQARGLPRFGMTGKPNISIKASLYFANSRVSKRSTTIQKRSRQPVFNETFQFDLSRERLPECDILFEIRHHGSMYRTPIGFVTVGNSAGVEGTQHWMQLLDFSYHEKVHKIMPFKPVNLL